MNSLTVFFDVGGTLQETTSFFEGIAKRLTGKKSDDKTRYLFSKMFVQLLNNTDRYQSVEDILANSLALFAKKHKYADISGEAHNIYFNAFLYEAKLFPDTSRVLDILYRNNVRMIIASDADVELMEEELVKYDIKKYFIDVCTSGLVRAYKPSDKFVDYLRKYTANNEINCYFVGDRGVDIECGKKLGIKSILVDRTNSKEQMDADYIIHDLRELLPILGLK